jgi:hypothetical protein
VERESAVDFRLAQEKHLRISDPGSAAAQSTSCWLEFQPARSRGSARSASLADLAAGVNQA